MPGNVVGFQTSSPSLLFFSFCFQGRSTESDVTPAFAFRSGLHAARDIVQEKLLTSCCSSFYVHIPPSRGLEIRTLEVVKEVYWKNLLQQLVSPTET